MHTPSVWLAVQGNFLKYKIEQFFGEIFSSFICAFFVYLFDLFDFWFMRVSGIPKRLGLFCDRSVRSSRRVANTHSKNANPMFHW